MKPVLAGGLVAGFLDIAAAFLVYSGLRGAPPLRILQAIASGLLGAAAFEGGLPTALLGLFLHFVIATGWTALYFILSRKIAGLARKPVVSGAVYGIAVYFLMNLVVLPLSAVPPRPFSVDFVILIVHVICVGIPIAFTLSRAAAAR
jgi:uncharacterized membrane protein YagU involved in acid resistance